MNAHRITVKETLEMHDIEDITECTGSIVPACCSEGCECEPDGECEHGCPSVLLASGLI